MARTGIMLVSHYRHLEREEGIAFGKELVLQGAEERLIPIAMTVLTAGLPLLPLVMRGEIAGQEIEYPMAIVILGRLTAATLLNPLVVPSFYLHFARAQESTEATAST